MRIQFMIKFKWEYFYLEGRFLSLHSPLIKHHFYMKYDLQKNTICKWEIRDATAEIIIHLVGN